MLSDNWAQKARNQGYRSRAVFKLKEILEKTKLTKICLLYTSDAADE